MLTGTQARAIRFRLGIKQVELSDLLGMPQGTWSRYETEDLPMTHVVERRFMKLMDELNVASYDEFPELLVGITAQELEEAKVPHTRVASREEPEDEPIVDLVNSPPHYADRAYEVIDVLQDSMTTEMFAGYLEGNVLKYIMRYKKKGKPLQDLEKAVWYLDRLVKLVQLEEEK